MTEQKRQDQQSADAQRESGQPGGGQGRVDEVGHSGVYPASGPLPEGNAEIQAPASWGQGERGAAGYQDSGGSEIWYADTELQGGSAMRQAAHGMTCRDIMTADPTCCLPNDTVDRAAMVMRSEDVGAVPVVNDQQELIGIVTDRDLALNVVADRRDAGSVTVESVMTSDPVCFHPEDSIQAVMDAMARYQLRRIPIVNQGNRVVGIIAQADIATRLQSDQLTGGVVEEISEGDTPREG